MLLKRDEIMMTVRTSYIVRKLCFFLIQLPSNFLHANILSSDLKYYKFKEVIQKKSGLLNKY